MQNAKGELQNSTLTQNLQSSRETPPPQIRSISLDIALTSRCPLSCRYCTVEKAPTPELSAERWDRVIGSIAGLASIESVSLEGGEPLLRPDLAQILASALRHARRVKIVTGGALPCRLPERLVSDPRFSFEVSLDGPPPIHDFLRHQSFDRAFRFFRECVRTGVRVRFRTVISRYNLPFYESWLEEMDRLCESGGQEVGFFFDTLIPPRALSGQGGPVPRAPSRNFPAGFLVPSPREIAKLFGRVKAGRFRGLSFCQDEPLRGCRPLESPCVSFDPAGHFSFCCESPNGFGSFLDRPPETCLALLAQTHRNLPCRACSNYGPEICSGCWSGQKCGMVGHWGFAHCRELADTLAAGKLSFPNPAPTPPPPF